MYFYKKKTIMIKKISIFSIQISILVLKSASISPQPEYSVKVLNKENIILSLGNIDDDANNELEVLRNFKENTQVEKKLNKFHKYVNSTEMTERPKERFYVKPHDKLRNFRAKLEVSYPDSPYEIAVDEKHLSRLERRQKKRRKKRKWWKRLGLRKFTGQAKNVKKRQLFSPDIEDIEAEHEYMEKEYWDYVAQGRQSNTAFKYSDEGKPEENLKDIVYKIVDLKTPQNCTNFTGIGFQAAECVIKNYKAGVIDKKDMIHGILIILLIWFCIYLAIVLPLWCLKGWCCCCFRCEFCFPEKKVNEIEEYIYLNPPGTYTNASGIKETYNPTQKEVELYEALRRLIADF